MKHINLKLTLLLFLLIRFYEAPAQYDLDRPSRLIGAEDGLPNYYTKGLVQDSYKFIWISSYDGLSRFDGNQMRTFFHEENDSLSIVHNSIMALAADPNNGEVWVGTSGGLSVYDPSLDQFRSYYNDPGDTTSLPTNFIQWVYVDRQSDVWISAESNILCRYNFKKNNFSRHYPKDYLRDSANPESEEIIRDVVQDVNNDSLLWINTNL